MLKELSDFYLLDDKLLYAHKGFIGYNPAISKPLTHESPDTVYPKVKVEEFEMQGSSFTVILIFFRASGPLRGYKRIEVIKNGRTIIRYEVGSKGFGSNYWEGNYFLVGDDNAYLVARGSSLMEDYKTRKIYNGLDRDSYYFFWFSDIVIPTAEEAEVNYDSFPEDRIYKRSEIEHLRRVEWHAKANFNNHEIDISRSSIPGFWQTKWDFKGEVEEFRKCKQMDALSEMRIIVDGVNGLEEKYNGS